VGQVRKRSVIPETSEQDMRAQEVLRANRELAAYFKGLRTEREARAALKIIKAFIRERERQDAGSRLPLPNRSALANGAAKRKAGAGGDAHKAKTRRRKAARKQARRPDTSAAASPNQGPALVPDDTEPTHE